MAGDGMGSGARPAGTLYPKVKVRGQHDPQSVQEETENLLLKVIESLALEGHYPSCVSASKHGDNTKSVSPLPSCERSNARLSNLSEPSNRSGSEGKCKKNQDQDKNTNIRASSVPRPRAVLSSPDNDDMIGHQNQVSREGGRLQALGEKSAGQCKPAINSIRMHSPAKTRESTKKLSNNAPFPKSKPSLTLEKPRRPITPGKRKPNPVWL